MSHENTQTKVKALSLVAWLYDALKTEVRFVFKPYRRAVKAISPENEAIKDGFFDLWKAAFWSGSGSQFSTWKGSFALVRDRGPFDVIASIWAPSKNPEIQLKRTTKITLTINLLNPIRMPFVLARGCRHSLFILSDYLLLARPLYFVLSRDFFGLKNDFKEAQGVSKRALAFAKIAMLELFKLPFWGVYLALSCLPKLLVSLSLGALIELPAFVVSKTAAICVSLILKVVSVIAFAFSKASELLFSKKEGSQIKRPENSLETAVTTACSAVKTLRVLSESEEVGVPEGHQVLDDDSGGESVHSRESIDSYDEQDGSSLVTYDSSIKHEDDPFGCQSFARLCFSSSSSEES
jgi:hypothetical protein